MPKQDTGNRDSFDRKIRKAILFSISRIDEPMSARRVVAFVKGYFGNGDPTRREIQAQLDHLVDLCAITRTRAGYEIY